MHHPILFGLLFGLLATRFLMRRRRRWAFAYTRGGGGCGGHRRHGRFHGRMFFYRGFDGDGGYDFPPDAWGRSRGDRRGADKEQPAQQQQRPQPGTVSQQVTTILGALDLNKRQREEADEAIASIRATLGDRFERWTHAGFALAAAGAEPFDRAGAEAALVALAEPDEHKELLDALEHLSNILTDEQRARLRHAARA